MRHYIHGDVAEFDAERFYNARTDKFEPILGHLFCEADYKRVRYTRRLRPPGAPRSRPKDAPNIFL